MSRITELRNYLDENENEISYSGDHNINDISILFSGSRNKLHVDQDAVISKLTVEFFGSDAEITIGGGGRASYRILIGSSSTISIGRQMTTTSMAYMTALDGGSIKIGRDCMLAGNVQIRADDAHAIFDVETGKRTNMAKPIVIGDHVWLGEGSVILGGTSIGNGSVVGMRSVVKCVAPNNCVIAGVPARVVKENVAWERPYFGRETLFNPDGTTKTISKEFWSYTAEE